MPVAIEDLIFDFLEEKIEAINLAEADFEEEEEHSPLYEAQLLDSPYAPIDTSASAKPYGIHIDDGDSDVSPNSGATEVEEFDFEGTLIIFYRVDGPNRSQRKAARAGAIALAMAVAKLFFDDPTMGARVNDSRVRRIPRGWANIKSTPYSVMNVPLIVNETGTNIP